MSVFNSRNERTKLQHDFFDCSLVQYYQITKWLRVSPQRLRSSYLAHPAQSTNETPAYLQRRCATFHVFSHDLARPPIQHCLLRACCPAHLQKAVRVTATVLLVHRTVLRGRTLLRRHQDLLLQTRPATVQRVQTRHAIRSSAAQPKRCPRNRPSSKTCNVHFKPCSRNKNQDSEQRVTWLVQMESGRNPYTQHGRRLSTSQPQ